MPTNSPSLDRKQRLAAFVDWSAQHITGDEKGQAQIFLDRLFQAFGQRGSLDVGGSPEFRIKKGQDEAGGTAFADYVWKPLVLIEMKKRGEDLARHRQQAFNYWIKLVPSRPQYTILCNFDEFWIYDFNLDLDDPLDTLKLTELPERYDPLNFLFPTNERPVFQNNRVEVTKKAADALATVFFHMTHTRKVDRELAQRFILQILVALFAEDIDLLPKNFLTNLLADIKTPEDSYDSLGGLFEAMNREHGTPAGRFKGIRYFNGGLFKEPARLALDKDGIELACLRNAAQENWAKVSPDIFGTLFQHSMDSGERHAFGAHYTAPMDIMKIVGPTIVEPWTQMIADASTPKKLLDLLQRLTLLRVLDPACGSGNFLYIAYREMKRLEGAIRTRLQKEFPATQAPLLHVNARQFFGMDILPFAIELAKVTMMIARKLSIDELHISDEPPLPLDNLDTNFLCTDALRVFPPPFDPKKNLQPTAKEVHAHFTTIQTPWPPADVIIGNPPFLGAKRLKPERGPDYVNILRKLYPEVPGMADYCVYWFRRAHDHLPVCSPDRPEIGRAGLVGTQNIRNNQSRVGGLDHIVKSGVIVEAVENQPWSGEANVHVSIANWVKTASSEISNPQISNSKPPSPAKLLIPAKKKLWYKVDPQLAIFDKSEPKSGVTTTGKSGKTLASKSYELDFRETSTINPALSDQTDTTAVGPLKCNTKPQRVFNGQFPRHHGFLLEPRDADAMIGDDKRNADVVLPFFIGQELVTRGKPERYVIDFQKRSILEAQTYKLPFLHIKKIVLPHIQSYAENERKKTGKDLGQDQTWLRTWWQHFRCRKEFVDSTANLRRYITCSGVTKRPIFAFVSTLIRPDHSLFAFSFDDDYSFGILQSVAHWLWFTTKCSKLTERFRYTPESVFDTFPWPQSPTKKQINTIATAGREIRRIRTKALESITGGLRALYRTLELPGKNPLKDAHANLDAAVLAAYGFSSSPTENRKPETGISPPPDLLAQLLALNLDIARKIERAESVTPPGVPPSYGDPAPLRSADCITP